MWKITDNIGHETYLPELMDEHPELVAYDESGFGVDPLDLFMFPEEVAKGGYFGKSERVILFFRDEHEAGDHDGIMAIARAVWEV